MLYPLFEAIPAVTIFADAPNNVPLPPKHAPKLKAHAKVLRGRASGSSSCKILIIGIIVAVYGMLSKNAEAIALTQMIRTNVIGPDLATPWPASSLNSSNRCEELLQK